MKSASAISPLTLLDLAMAFEKHAREFAEWVNANYPTYKFNKGEWSCCEFCKVLSSGDLYEKFFSEKQKRES